MFIFLKTRRRHSGRFYHHKDPQIFDLLQFSKKEVESKTTFLRLKKRLQKLNDRYENEAEPSRINFLQMEKTIMRRRVENAAALYRMVRRERMRLFREYMDRLPARSQLSEAAA